MIAMSKKNFCHVWIYFIVFLHHKCAADLTSVSTGKPVTMSSTADSFEASRGVDGNTNGNMNAGSCFHTIMPNEYKPWWSVDLVQVYKVYAVTIANRDDCCSERLYSFEVGMAQLTPLVYTPPYPLERCFYHPGVLSSQIQSFWCDRPVIGRYLVMQHYANWGALNVCEVMVFGVLLTGNLALGKPANQSSENPALTLPAELAVDGNADPYMANGGCMLTDSDVAWSGTWQPWWMVDLEAMYYIQTVNVINSDELAIQMYKVDIRVLADKNNLDDYSICLYYGDSLQSGANGSMVLNCKTLVRGRFVQLIVLDSSGSDAAISICEVEVYGYERLNLAYEKPARMSSLQYSSIEEIQKGIGAASRAVDGLLEPRDADTLGFHVGICAHTLFEAVAWWEVDLQGTYTIEEVAILNRATESHRLRDFAITIYEEHPTVFEECANFTGIAPSGENGSFPVPCDRLVAGQVVRITLYNEILTLCEVEVYQNVDQCINYPCMNGGVCEDGILSATCHCPAWTTGEFCETDIDECGSAPCQNDGTCQNLHSAFKCDCASGKTGQFCEIDIDECLSDPCMNGASCLDEINGFDCVCSGGFTGVRCENEIMECLSDPCENGGVCEDLVNAYTCHCPAGWAGHNCSQEMDECLSDPCNNGATCVDAFNGYNCACANSFTGVHCENDVYNCATNPCKNSGVCSDTGLNSYSCSCQAGWAGNHCTQNVDECDSSPCLNGATCVDSVNLYYCICRQGWNGIHCEKAYIPPTVVTSAKTTSTTTTKITLSAKQGEKNERGMTDLEISLLILLILILIACAVIAAVFLIKKWRARSKLGAEKPNGNDNKATLPNNRAKNVWVEKHQ